MPEVTISEEAESLAQVNLFRRLTADELEQLAEAVDQVRYKAGDTIFNEMDKGDALYVVDAGSGDIWVRDEDVKPVIAYFNLLFGHTSGKHKKR